MTEKRQKTGEEHGGNTEIDKICLKYINTVGPPESTKIIIEASSRGPKNSKKKEKTVALVITQGEIIN